ncbi:MAG: LPS-assembly protein LptD [Pseudomonadota bacterium]
MTRTARKPLQGGRGDALHRGKELLRAVEEGRLTRVLRGSRSMLGSHSVLGRQPSASVSSDPVASNPVWARPALTLMTAALLLSTVSVVTTPSKTAHAQTVDAPVASPAPAFNNPGTGLLPNTDLDRSQPLYLQGDELIYDNSGNSVTARGNVEIFYNNYILTADEVTYDQSANTLTAVGNVALKEPNGNVVRADRYTLTDDFRDGFVESLRVTTSDDSRITARRGTRREGNVTEFEDGKFTPCKTVDGSPPLWCVSAARIIHDQEAATISYQDAQFEVFGVPVLYLPYFQHADPSVKRKSGFLLPKYGTSDDLGFFTEVPYYFALATNYDFTFRPRYMTQQGTLWQGDWRHRLANGQYTISFAGLDQDANDLPNNDPDRDGFRGSIETKGLFSLSSWWQAGWDVTLETDDTFRRFYKLDNILLTDRVNRTFLVGQSDRNYFSANFYQFGGLTLEDDFRSESRVHPVIDYSYVVKDPVVGGELSFDTNVLSFSRGDFAGDGTGQQDLNRVIADVKWRKRLIDPIGITYTPFANLRGDLYQFGNFIDAETGDPNDNETVARGVAAGGITVTYPWIASSAQASHTIEPIGQVIGRTASTEQRALPNEDAQSLVFDDTNLFDIDKFSGYDRVETGSRANAGLQYTFQTNWGGHARLLAGQSFHLGGENAFSNPGNIVVDNPATLAVEEETVAAFNPDSGLETSQSDYVLGAYLSPVDQFRLIGQARFDENDLGVRRIELASFMTYGPASLTTLYSYRNNDPEDGSTLSESEVSAVLNLQLTDNWSVGAQGRFDIDEEAWLSDTFRIRYADECFVLTASYSETLYDDATRDLEPDRTVYLQFQLKHIGDFEYKTDALDFVFGDEQPPA